MSKKTAKSVKSVKDILQSVYFVVWLLLVLASVVPQAYPILFNPLVVEGAKFATVILISIFGAYLFVKRSERKISGFKGTVSETDKKIKELNARTDKALQEIDGLTSAFNNFKNDQEQRYKDIRTELGQYKNGVSKVDTFLQKNQQALSILSKRLENFFFVTCPNCNTRINLDFPNTIISGMHDVDGPASDSTSRDTSEIELQCPQCKRKYHIDIPHTELIKT